MKVNIGDIKNSFGTTEFAKEFLNIGKPNFVYNDKQEPDYGNDNELKEVDDITQDIIKNNYKTPYHILQENIILKLKEKLPSSARKLTPLYVHSLKNVTNIIITKPGYGMVKGIVGDFNDEIGVAIIRYNSPGSTGKIEKFAYNHLSFCEENNINMYENAIKTIKSYKDTDYFCKINNYTFTYIFYSIGIFNKDTFIEYNKYFGKDHIGEYKDFSEDIMMYLPEDSCTLNSYNEHFVMWYIEQLNSFGFGKINILKKEPHELYNDYKSNKHYNDILFNNSFYYLHITGETSDFKMILLKLLTFLFHNGNEYIPGIFRNFVEERCTENVWQAFLLCFVASKNQTLFNAGIFNHKKFGLFAAPNVLSKHNSVEALIKKTKSEIEKTFKYEFVDEKLYASLNIKNKKQICNFLTTYKQIFL